MKAQESSVWNGQPQPIIMFISVLDGCGPARWSRGTWPRAIKLLRPTRSAPIDLDVRRDDKRCCLSTYSSSVISSVQWRSAWELYGNRRSRCKRVGLGRIEPPSCYFASSGRPQCVRLKNATKTRLPDVRHGGVYSFTITSLPLALIFTSCVIFWVWLRTWIRRTWRKSPQKPVCTLKMNINNYSLTAC